MGGERNLAALLCYLSGQSVSRSDSAKVVTVWQLSKHFGNILGIKVL